MSSGSTGSRTLARLFEVHSFDADRSNMAKAAPKFRVKKTAGALPLDQRLVLNQWLVSLFEVADFAKLTEEMKDPALEGFDENGVSHFHRRLSSRLLKTLLPDDVLLACDENIVRHWRRIIAGHEKAGGHRLYPKYFQYLALLFTEIYLDRFVTNPVRLRNDLNAHVRSFNAADGASDPVEEYTDDQLNKLAFMQATGSGKTLLMHVNILQYRHYLERAPAERRHELALNRVILLTPNEGLSRQHKREFDRSGIPAELFDKDARSLFAGTSVEIIDIHKLRDDSGDKTVAVEAFESNNLVLVDEGHRGASGKESGDWIKRRNALCEKGFSFEYSATFKQAVRQNQKLREVYSKGIIFDYSYRYFYADGYGKEYHILNLDDDSKEDRRQLYLTACLLTFYQQRRLWLDRRVPLQQWLVESPLLVFVGGRRATDRPPGRGSPDAVGERQLVVCPDELDEQGRLDVPRLGVRRRLPADHERLSVRQLPDVPPAPVPARRPGPEPQVQAESRAEG